MFKRCYLEITDACNLNCPFCTNAKGQDFMSFPDICKSLDEIKEICDYVYLHVLGEPLLHPDIEKIFDYCDSLNLKVQLVTNGLLFKEHKEIYKHPSLRKLSISLHSVNNIEVKENYFETISWLIENCDKYLELRFYNKEQLDEKLSSYLVILYDHYDVEETCRFNSYRLKNNVFISYADLFRWPDINDSFISDTGYCHGGLDQIAILHNLDVTLCCLDPKGHNIIGNLRDNSLKDILESESYLEYSQAIKKRRLVKELCTKCSYRQRFDDKNN